MTQELEATFRDLGLAQYLGSFVDQGFDTWDTILDIQESDLNELGVKLGHRRKLQRRIANARGIATSMSLSAPAKQNAEDARRDGSRPGQGRSEANQDGTGVVKRKYRRHPKPDENAPERPPSAYVLFSNKMREDLKGHNLTFTEIAKLVGENWQSLPPAEKEAYESQANTAKKKYHRDLAEYKKTSEYRTYAEYLQEFKEKQANQNQDASKRPKIESRLRHGSTSSSAVTGGMWSSSSGSGSVRGSRSSSERMQGSEPPPTRRERVNWTASTGESMTCNGTQPSTMSPQTATFELNGARRTNDRNTSIQDGGRGKGVEGDRQALPSLSDMLEDGRPTMTAAGTTSDGDLYTASTFPPANARAPMPKSPFMPPAAAARAPVPFLRHEQSPAGSSGSGSSASSAASFGGPPGPGDGPMPIHALLSNRTAPAQMPSPPHKSSSPTFPSMPAPADHAKPGAVGTLGPRGYGFQSAPSALQHMKIEQAGGGDVVMTSLGPPPPPGKANGKGGLDGMSALLRAGEIVDGRDDE